MKPKTKAFVYNMLGFIALFLIFRFLVGLLVDWQSFYQALVAALLASLLSPKFGVVRQDQTDKVFMQWFLIKGPREV